MIKSEELLTANGVDYSEAMDRFGGNEELYWRIAAKFPDDPHYAELEAALERNDIEAAYRHAHALKGVAGNLSFGTLYRAACRVTDVLHSGDVPAACAIMTELSEAHTSVIASLLRLRQD